MFKPKNHRFGFFIGDMMYQFLSHNVLRVHTFKYMIISIFQYTRILGEAFDEITANDSETVYLRKV